MDSVVHELDHLSPADLAFLRKLERDLQLLADLSQSDVAMHVQRSRSEAVVVAQARPRSILPIHTESRVGQRVTADSEPEILRALTAGRSSSGQHPMQRGQVSIYQQVHPVFGSDGRVLAAVCIETSLLERERHRRRNRVYQQALKQIQSMILAGALRGSERLSAVGEHEGALVIDAQHNIRFASAIAANLYRKLGVTGDLEKKCLEELDVDDNSEVLEVLENGECLETEVRIQDHVWIKKVIPLQANGRRWPRLMSFRNGHSLIDGVLLLVSDVTEQRRREQELQIKVTMIREVHHRVKNNLQTIASLLRMQARRSDSEDVRRALTEGTSRIMSVAVIHEFLAHQDAKVINVRDVGQRILGQIREGILDRDKKIRLELHGPNILLPTQQATACALVINELVQNAVEHGFGSKPSGLVSVNLQDDGNQVTIVVEDDGVGLPDDFTIDSTTSLGLQIVQNLVQGDLKGSFELCGRDSGVSAQVTFPKQLQGGN